MNRSLYEDVHGADIVLKELDSVFVGDCCVEYNRNGTIVGCDWCACFECDYVKCNYRGRNINEFN